MGRLLSRQGAAREAKLGSAESLAGSVTLAGLSPQATAVSSRNATRDRSHFAVEAKCVSLRRKKRYTTNLPGTERAGLAARFSPSQGLTFHLGWQRRRAGPSLDGRGSASNE
jgi:hypothetical protein